MTIKSSHLLSGVGEPLPYSTTDETNITAGQFVTTKCLQFGGSGIYVDLGFNFNYEWTDPFTINMWYKGTLPAWWQEVAGNFGGPTQYRGWAFRIDTAGKLAAFISNDLTAGNDVSISGSTVVTTNTWKMLTFSSSGASSGGLALYINAVNESGSQGGTISATAKNSNNCRIGTGVGLSTNYVTGRICEVVMTNIALSQTQITALYGAGKPQDPKKIIEAANISGHWRFGTNDYNPVAKASTGLYYGSMVGMSSSSIVTDAP